MWHCYALKLDKQTIVSRVQRRDAEGQVYGVGTVAVRFRLEGWRVKPISIEFRAPEP
jgi:hypothetical protein